MGLTRGTAKIQPESVRKAIKQQQKDRANMIEHQKASIDAEIAKFITFDPKAGKAELKKQLVKTLVRSGHTRQRAIQLVKENWGK